ncbi:peptidyl-prolyl cis-trans isomerase [Hamiltosporidium tvaerminnensis]|uniref:Peptidyl-prolyl cis-trans isomerase n=2 Tax=Hamiltosporidium TaxID=1176354 RepID=A0A4Q9LJQ1_9MICR|nr:peptidyl-prolyl cis-trans isomerase [Hamiltosporidium tvaerminnensis]TBU07310.1 peptidyl-prolyl cis-trans isomerase [Hamiltosporidium magnivora]TBU08297.1 peptidyl-prolyl cis-trans isomerase [Hamiltosporidium magnivora]TBU08763.1 peptidyl-prolyl cis-trans isomerase [Hamiltosporidium magnivora]TBU11590.1 peptidyl-prolyl cis-trans isomerase [Hamiltosporidium tvaerminnensis]
MWIRKKSRKYNKYYFYNEDTGESIWKHPKTNFKIYHILIKHENSRKPNNDYTYEMAVEKINEIINILEENRNILDFLSFFMKIAEENSMCSSFKRGGYLGTICKNEMLKEFEDVALSLGEDEFKGPVSTDSGLHIIYRSNNN